VNEAYDVIVAGGGLAGVCAASAAAQAGARTLLIEKAPFAGGIATASLEPSICNYFHNASGEAVLGGRPRELVERMAHNGAASPGWHTHRGHVIFDVELGKRAMDEMLDASGVEILYDSIVVAATVDGQRLASVTVANRSGLVEYSAACYVDATGDNDLAAYAGAPQRTRGQDHSILFRLGNVDMDRLVDYTRRHPEEHYTDRDIALSHDEVLHIYEQTGRFQWHHFAAKKMRLIQDPVERGEYDAEWREFFHMDAFQIHGIRETGTLVVNTGFFKLAEPTGESVSHWLREGRKLAAHVHAFMRRVVPGCENSFLLATANAPGLRRTRWLDADFTMTRDEYDAGTRYDDAVGRGVRITKGALRITDTTFDIPLRCLLPRNLDNLVVGSGRGASCEPAELLRVMPVTMAVGQGAGVAAAVAGASNRNVADVEIDRVRRALRDQDADLAEAKSAGGASV
jgi:glycine/D-amino acid oxidase-like deaminating enzyme